jgi:hypothetical protein
MKLLADENIPSSVVRALADMIVSGFEPKLPAYLMQR